MRHFGWMRARTFHRRTSHVSGNHWYNKLHCLFDHTASLSAFNSFSDSSDGLSGEFRNLFNIDDAHVERGFSTAQGSNNAHACSRC
ncbi:MAG: hypothetical protein M1118_01415 [Chloroflexi bacterium]|nr:hypothetical protein [Chloroflexota bacterium]